MPYGIGLYCCRGGTLRNRITVEVAWPYRRTARFGGGFTAGQLRRPLVNPYGLLSVVREKIDRPAYAIVR